MERFSPYMKLFCGERVCQSEIQRLVPYVQSAIDTLVKDNKIIGQFTLEGDVEIWMPDKVKHEICFTGPMIQISSLVERFEGNWDTTNEGDDRINRDMATLRKMLAKWKK